MLRFIVLLGSTLVAVVLFSGCSSSKVPVTSAMDRSHWVKVRPSELANVDKAAMPEISAATHYAAGQLKHKQGDLQAALNQYRQAIACDPRFIAALNSTGILCTQLGRFDQAIDAFQQAITLLPQTAYLRNNLGFAYLLAGRLDDARAELGNAINIQENFARAHANLAIVLAKQGKYDQSLESFRRADCLADAHFNLACMYQFAGRTDLASRYYKQALKFQPKFPAAQRALKSIETLASVPGQSQQNQAIR